MQISIRKIEAQDEKRWRELWEGYCRFYEKTPSEVSTQYLWKRIMEPASSVFSIVAVNADNHIVGMANYILHENTWMLTPVCYLQDLYVDPQIRSQGVGRALIDWLVAEMKQQKWSSLYWHTKENNYLARILYDSYTSQSGFLRYAINNSSDT